MTTSPQGPRLGGGLCCTPAVKEPYASAHMVPMTTPSRLPRPTPPFAGASRAAPTPAAAPGDRTCGKCGKPMTLFDGTWAHSHVMDMFTCTGVNAIPGGPAKMPAEDFAARMAEQSMKALDTKDWGTT